MHEKRKNIIIIVLLLQRRMDVTATVDVTQMHAAPALLWGDLRVGVSTGMKAMATFVQVCDACRCIDGYEGDGYFCAGM